MMQSFLVGSLPNASSFTTGGNLWQSTKHGANKNKYYSSSYAPKASRNTQKEYKFLRFHQPNSNHHDKCIERQFTYQECNKEYVVRAAPAQSFESENYDSDSKNILDSAKNLLIVLYTFCTPHAQMTRILCTISASLLAVKTLSDISPLLFTGILQALVAYVFMDIYVCTVNQLFDIEIDKINKPYLPLASGQLSYTAGVIITASSLFLSLLLAWITGSWPLIWSVILICALWTAYSANVPLLRWKGNPVLAAIVIFASWAIIFPISSFLHIQTSVFKRSVVFPKSLNFVIAFMSFYILGIAVMKDIPDIEGDEAFGIHSFSARFGKKQVFWICVSLFEMAFVIAVMMGATSSFLWSKIVTVLGYGVLASVLGYRAKFVDLESKPSMTSFFLLNWKVLQVAYLLMPLTR
ncbi:glycinol 4-dimethylallyltransferase-like [Lotus japonicus]|uniref:glycinol 4-dimethylallyltransferase-like n=1 Tax=Lotus japonicus TaxID=34305 RepID=UPI00258625BC|nr:glycinol 4-dimethylallyltransferase-like [Lotus japonicus]